jgi:prepilin-type N-terminal cleavage/methylation domain-containing protein
VREAVARERVPPPSCVKSARNSGARLLGVARAGFSMVELMVVVVIVGVLATVGISLMREYIYSSKSAEAVSVIQAIRAAQERWRAETQTYLDVSLSLTTYYPNTTPNKDRFNWEQPGHTEVDKWRRLNVHVTQPVQFGYATVAGTVGDPLPEFDLTEDVDWSGTVIVEPWYLIQARGDADGDGNPTMFAASSFNGEVYYEERDE